MEEKSNFKTELEILKSQQGVVTKKSNREILEKSKSRFDRRVIQITDRLFDAQMSRAVGLQILYKVEKLERMTTNSYKKTYIPQPVKIVKDPKEIAQYLNGMLEGGNILNEEDPRATYYYITTQEPDNSAIESLLNRTYGKAKESIDLTADVKFSLRDLARVRDADLFTPDVIDAKVKSDVIDDPDDIFN